MRHGRVWIVAIGLAVCAIVALTDGVGRKPAPAPDQLVWLKSAH